MMSEIRPASPIVATLAALALTVAVYAGIAWLASGIEIPAGVPTAKLSWIAPSRVVATTGFAIAWVIGMPHIAGDFIAAVLLGGVLGSVFTLSRRVIGG